MVSLLCERTAAAVTTVNQEVPGRIRHLGVPSERPPADPNLNRVFHIYVIYDLSTSAAEEAACHLIFPTIPYDRPLRPSEVRPPVSPRLTAVSIRCCDETLIVLWRMHFEYEKWKMS